MSRKTISGNVAAPQAAFLALSIRSTTPRGKPTTMPAKISSDIPLPTPRSVICSPSHMMNALPVVRVSMVMNLNFHPGSSAKAALLQADRDAERLHRAQNDRDVARPLRDLLAPEFAFLLQLGQRLIHHGQQLQNDRCRNVRHDSQGKNRHAAQLAAGEQIDKSQQRSARAALREETFQLGGIDSRRRKVAAQPVHEQHRQGKQDAFAQVRNPEDVSQFVEHYCPQDLNLAARLGDLFLCRLRKFVRVHRDRDLQLAVAQNLYRMLRLDHSRLAQHLRSDGLAVKFFAHLHQPLQTDDVEFLAENIGEATLRHAAMQRHLPAFKAANHARASARTLPLVSTGRSLAHAGAHAAPHALALFRRLLRCSNIR